jgi:hypothetical protein
MDVYVRTASGGLIQVEISTNSITYISTFTQVGIATLFCNGNSGVMGPLTQVGISTNGITCTYTSRDSNTTSA